MKPIVEFPKSSLPNFSCGEDPDLIWMRCKNPTKNTTQDGLYQGYIQTHHRGFWGEHTVTLFHFINDKGIHSTCSLLRFSRSSASYVAKKIKENEQKVNKDNPVPSIDDLFKIYEDFRDSRVKFLIYIIGKNHEKDPIANRLEEIKSLYNEPQNGRETDKEQPIKPRCICKEPHYGFKEVAVCIDCNGIKDKTYWDALKASKG